MSDMPADPMSQTAVGATATHEMLLSFITAGFERHEALYLCGRILAAGVRAQLR